MRIRNDGIDAYVCPSWIIWIPEIRTKTTNWLISLLITIRSSLALNLWNRLRTIQYKEYFVIILSKYKMEIEESQRRRYLRCRSLFFFSNPSMNRRIFPRKRIETRLSHPKIDQHFLLRPGVTIHWSETVLGGSWVNQMASTGADDRYEKSWGAELKE